MYYPEEIIEEVRSRNDIVDVISGYVPLKRKGNSYFGCCPFHNEKTPSFSVSRDRQMYYCFGCGAGGNVYTFLMEYENLSFQEAIRTLAERAGVELPKEEISAEEKRAGDYRAMLREINREAARYFYGVLKSPRGKRGYDYLIRRGITPETIVQFGLGFSDIYRDDLYRYLKQKKYTDQQIKDSGLVTIEEKGIHDKFWNRVMYPIFDVNNRVIGFGGRVLGEGTPKYLNSPETAVFDKSRNLYGLNRARSSRKGNLIICEGYMDVIAMHQAGFTNAVASLGTALTEPHAALLRRYTQDVILAYDSDGAGVRAALRAIPILKRAGLSVRVLDMQPYKDPDEFMKQLGKDEFEQRIRKAVSSFMYEAQKLADEYDQNDPESRTSFQHALAKKLAGIPEKLERDNYTEAVANQYQMAVRDLEKLVNVYGSAGVPQTPSGRGAGEGRRQKERKEEGKNMPQRILLTWMVHEPSLFETLREYVGPEDFMEPADHKIAEMLFRQYEQSGQIEPAMAMDLFSELEEQKNVAAILNTKLDVPVLPEDRSKALTDIVRKVKLAGIEARLSQSTDIAKWQELIKEKANLQKLHIFV